MADPILADQIRAFTFEHFVAPKLSSGLEIAVRAGDVHKAMGFTSNRVPLVVGSLRARYFTQQYGLQLVRKEGKLVSTTTTFIFQAGPQATTATPPTGAVWAEITSLEHGHGGLGWELGRWLWSPTTSLDGAKRYAVMLQPQPGDQVFHLVSGMEAKDPRRRVLFGTSRVAASAEETAIKPPMPGDWGDASSYFRIRLESFTEFPLKLSMDDVEAELADVILADLAERPKYYPYAPYRDGFRGAQDIYLTKLTPTLAEALRETAGIVASTAQPDVASQTAKATIQEFAEGERSRREAAFFKRNPALRAAAIAKHGLHCQGCERSLAELYGALGEGYIEIHHLDPLAERPVAQGAELRVTTVDDVAPLCANCHRMVHRSRPAMSLVDLRLAIAAAPFRHSPKD